MGNSYDVIKIGVISIRVYEVNCEINKWSANYGKDASVPSISIIENGAPTISNEVSIVENEASIIPNEESIVENEASIISSGVSIAENKAPITPNEASIVENELSVAFL